MIVNLLFVHRESEDKYKEIYNYTKNDKKHS